MCVVFHAALKVSVFVTVRMSPCTAQSAEKGGDMMGGGGGCISYCERMDTSPACRGTGSAAACCNGTRWFLLCVLADRLLEINYCA